MIAKMAEPRTDAPRSAVLSRRRLLASSTMCAATVALPRMAHPKSESRIFWSVMDQGSAGIDGNMYRFDPLWSALDGLSDDDMRSFLQGLEIALRDAYSGHLRGAALLIAKGAKSDDLFANFVWSLMMAGERRFQGAVQDLDTLIGLNPFFVTVNMVQATFADQTDRVGHSCSAPPRDLGDVGDDRIAADAARRFPRFADWAVRLNAILCDPGWMEPTLG